MNLLFTSYFNYSFDLFLSNWLSKRLSSQTCGVWNFFSGNYWSLAQQSRIRLFKFEFQFPVFKPKLISKFPNFRPEKGHFLVYFDRPKVFFKMYIFSGICTMTKKVESGFSRNLDNLIAQLRSKSCPFSCTVFTAI